MSKIAILADSSCDFTPERAQKAGFSVVPLQVTFEDGSVYRDGIDLTSEEFFKKLAASKQLPKTSQPTIETWMDAMKQFADYDDIIVITVSGKVSGSLSGASMARRMLREEEEFQPNIHLIDSMTASGAVAASRWKLCAWCARAVGHRRFSTVCCICRIIWRCILFLTAWNICAKAAALERQPLLRARSWALSRCSHFLRESRRMWTRCAVYRPAAKSSSRDFCQRAADLHHVMVISSCAPERVEMITRMLQTHISDIAITYVEIGAVIGTYVGPGGIALVYEEKEARW